MNHSNVREAIENNEGLANDMFEVEMSAFGSAKTFEDMKRALNIQN